MEQRMEKTTRRRWTQEESEGFLRCYLARKAEFEHPKKKRQAYANTLEDMICLGITDSGRTPLCLEGRMRTLLQAYKAARDNNNRTGSSPCFDPYMELMEEIFGSSPIISNSHTLQLGDGPVQMLEESSPIPAPSPPSSSTTSSPLSQSALPLTSSSLPRQKVHQELPTFYKTDHTAIGIYEIPGEVQKKWSNSKFYQQRYQKHSVHHQQQHQQQPNIGENF
ncbi:PREDICTED: uncharacterized protein LOC108370266 [Rhagoletis zephyria]|uniref:uncharacterized protein LOC108370266 n=1 Tax=Rhagoletis zephyria TaxID=28612 RepID=UPI00081163E6|nr:PREDICTED: uncharacterized protein LOC108370266 [Rhagoletis zephyria]